MADAGPSKLKRPRYEHKNPVASTSKLPAMLDVEKFSLARAAEISSMERAMKASRDSGAQRAFQSLPRHLRRRAASHHIRRLPYRLRAKAKLEIIKEQGKVISKRKFRNLPKVKKFKLLNSTRLQVLHKRQGDKAWLETHIWHAKRMKMVNIWAYRLAYTPTEKSFRPSYRAAFHGVLLHDISYYQTIELIGQFQALQTILAMFCDPSAVPASSTRYCWGPATIIWAASTASDDPSASRQLFIRFHPSILLAMSTTVQSAIEALRLRTPLSLDDPWDEKGSLDVKMHFRNLCAFELTGPMATDAIKACLKPVDKQGGIFKKAWENLPAPASVPPGTVISFNVHDPRLTFPPKLPKSAKSLGKAAAVQPSHDLAENARFWDASVRKKLEAPRYSKIQLDERREKLLLPGTELPAEDDDDRVPVLLIQKSVQSNYITDPKASSSSVKPDVTLAGWTLIVPSGWGTAFWHSLVYADTRVGGLRERAQQSFETGTPNFPHDFPCTTAYRKDMKVKAAEDEGKWKKRPVAKRINYNKLKIDSPWQPDFQKIVQNSFKEAQKYQASAGGESSAMQVDQAQQDTKPDGKARHPWLPTGPLLQKYLKLLSESVIKVQDAESLSKAAEAFEGLIKKEKAKRMPSQVKDIAGKGPKSAIVVGEDQDEDEDGEPVMHLNNINTSILLETALIRISLTPVRRGKPDFNAHIYKMDSAQSDNIRNSLADYKKESDPKRVMQAMLRKKANSKGKAAATEENDEEEDVAEEEEDSEDDEENETFKPPLADQLIGYVTTGSLSLARGHGYGIASISLLSLLHIMNDESNMALQQKNKLKLLVLYRNTNSKTCRPATLEILV